MNSIQKIFRNLPDKELTKAAKEVLAWKNTGLLKGETLRQIAREVKAQGIRDDQSLGLAETGVLNEVAYRYIKMMEGK